MNPVVHFEMPLKDKKRMVDFYTHAFGWQMKDMGPEMGDYVVVTTSETGADGLPTKSGRINGGFFKKTEEDQRVSVVISVDDIEEAMRKIKEAGGTVFGGQVPGKPDDIPGIGLYISFIDTEGNRVGVLQPSPAM